MNDIPCGALFHSEKIRIRTSSAWPIAQVMPANECQDKSCNHETGPKSRDNPHHSKPQVPRKPVSKCTCRDEIATQGKESINSKGSVGGATEEVFTCETSELESVRNQHSESKKQTKKIQRVGLRIEHR